MRNETDKIGVGVSFGKDSMAVLDLCCHLFPKVTGYYLYRVENLEIVKKWEKEVFDRYRIKVLMYPHFDLSRCYRHALFQPHWKETENVPKIDMSAIESKFRADTGVDWLAYGWRRNDSYSRALIMKKCAGIDFKFRRVFPLRAWKRMEVLEFLKQRKIPIPDSLGRKEQGGLDFHERAISALSGGDLEKWMNDFPFSGVQTIGKPLSHKETPSFKELGKLSKIKS